MKYMIIDWAGNPMWNKDFDSFDAASDYLSDKFGHLDDKAYEEELGEYAIVEKQTRESRYLDPSDSRRGLKHDKGGAK